MKMKVFSVLFAGFALAMSVAGCGNNNATTAGSCQAGQVYTQQYGCLAQGSCPAGQALYNNQCVLTSGTQTGGICQAGQVSTAQGCAQQAPYGSCPVNGQTYGWMNNQCVVGTISYGQTGTQACAAGQVYTQQYGCQAVAQANYCPSNGQQQYAWVNNQCVLGISTNSPYGQCQAGTVYTQQYGCLPQGNCPMGQALMSNQCIPAGYNNYNGGGGFGFYIGFGVGASCPYGTYYYNGWCVR